VQFPATSFDRIGQYLQGPCWLARLERGHGQARKWLPPTRREASAVGSLVFGAAAKASGRCFGPSIGWHWARAWALERLTLMRPKFGPLPRQGMANRQNQGLAGFPNSSCSQKGIQDWP